VKLAKFIPWEEFEVAYAKNLSGSGLGPPAMSVRIALGSLIVKELESSFFPSPKVKKYRKSGCMNKRSTGSMIVSSPFTNHMCGQLNEAKIDCTSETAIALVFLVMNLEKWLQSFLFSLFLLLLRFNFNENGSLKSYQAS
jgi:hypothetical protein